MVPSRQEVGLHGSIDKRKANGTARLIRKSDVRVYNRIDHTLSPFSPSLLRARKLPRPWLTPTIAVSTSNHLTQCLLTCFAFPWTGTMPSARSHEARGSDALHPAGPNSSAEGPGLVSYLQQMHGLSKRRASGPRTTKRARTAETRPAATSPSSRPILPRLSLPDARASPYPLPSGNQPHTYPMARTEARRARRGSWLAAQPLDSPPSPSFPSPHLHNAIHGVMDTGGLSHASEMSPMALGPPYVSPVSPVASGQPFPQAEQLQHAASPTNLPLIVPPLSYNEMWRPAPTMPEYTPMIASSPSQHSFSDSQGTTPLPSPSLTAPAAGSAFGAGVVSTSTDDSENQPFIVTPEYEAMANAQFKEALQLSSMQASLHRAQTRVQMASMHPTYPHGVHGVENGLSYSSITYMDSGQYPHHIDQSTGFDVSSSGSW